MTTEEIEIIRSAIRGKIELTDTMTTQMDPHVRAGVIKNETLQRFYTAKEALLAAWVKLEENRLEDAVYFLMRGCWNLGEFLAMSKHDRAASADIADPSE